MLFRLQNFLRPCIF